MNEKNLYHGKRVDNGEWVEGDLIHRQIWGRALAIIRISDDGFEHYEEYEVIPESVGQFTGLTGKNGNKIFEGDIVKCLSLENGYVNKEVYYAEDRARFVLGSLGSDYDFEEYINVEVIGNIYDNPELLHNGD